MTKQELKECITEVKYGDMPKPAKKKVMNVLYDELHKNGWIPCSERMPEKDGTYICSFLEESESFVGMTTFSDGKWDEDGVVAW